MLLNTAFWLRLEHRIAYRDAMPTLTVTHEAPLELIRQHPSLAVELVRATLSIPLPEDLEARLGPTDLNNVVPAQFTADSVVTLHDPGTGEPVLVVIIEPQGRADVDKQYSWPAYVTNVRRAARCPRAVLVVICPDPAEGEKCRQAIPTGHPTSSEFRQRRHREGPGAGHRRGRHSGQGRRHSQGPRRPPSQADEGPARPGQRGHRSRPTRPLVRPGADRRHRRRGLCGLTQAHSHSVR